MTVTLLKLIDTDWHTLSAKKTNLDGRISTFLDETNSLTHGTYQLCFNLRDAFGDDSFYPKADVVFTINDDGHYHIPLLVSHFGYSTYRGS